MALRFIVKSLFPGGDRRIDGKSVHFSPTQQQMTVVRKKPPTLSIQTHPVICDSTPDTMPGNQKIMIASMDDD
mgnify:FL=1